MRVGIDLDNTIIHYDDAFVTAAKERSLVPADFSGTKQQLRDHVRTLPNGETEWQKLQGHVYGQGISYAGIYNGVIPFITQAIAGGHELFIVSHKTDFGHYDETKTNLRDAALQFLETQGFFTTLGFKRSNIFFAATRSEKVNTIASLGLEWFIDDLVEVFEEADFPAQPRKILFHTASHAAPAGNWQVCGNWHDITKKIFA